MAFKLADFFVDLKVQGDTLTLKTMVNSMADMKLETLGEIGALTLLASSFKSAAQQAMQLGIQYTALKKNFDVDTSMVQRWQNVARSVSAVTVTPEGVQQSFQNLAQLLSGPLAGDPSSKFFQAAGRILHQNVAGMKAEDVEEMLRVRAPQFVKQLESLPGGSHQAAINATNTLLGQMGQSLGMLSLYSLSPNQFARGERSSNIIGSTDVERWAQLSKQVDVVGHNLFMMGQEILAKALPELISWTNALIRAEHALDGFLGDRLKTTGENLTQPYYGPTGFGYGDVSRAIAEFISPGVNARTSAASVTLNNHVYLQDRNGAHKKIAQTTGKFGVSQQDLTQAQLLSADLVGW